MPLPAALPLPVRSLAREEVYARLSDWIIGGTLQPGEALRDQDIAERLGVSRTPVREALRRLEDEGLVETALNRWTRVAPLRPSQAAELYPVIEVLEVLALRLALPLAGPALDRLEALNRQLQVALDGRDARGAVEADTAFHGTWVALAQNRELEQTLSGLKRKLQRLEQAYFHAAHSDASVQEHTALLTALRQQNLEAAVTALEQNWRGSLERLQTAL